MQQLQLAQIEVALRSQDLSYGKLEDAEAVVVGFGDRVGVRIGVDRGRLELHADVLQPLGHTARHVLQALNEVADSRHGPQAVVHESDEGCMVAFDQMVPLPIAQTPTVRALVVNFTAQVMGNRETLLGMLDAPEAVERLLAEFKGDGSP